MPSGAHGVFCAQLLLVSGTLGSMSSSPAAFESDGFAVFPEVVTAPRCTEVAGHVSGNTGAPVRYRRLLEQRWCLELAQEVRNHPAVRACLDEADVPLHCVYFDKSPSRNWLVPWHQDLSAPAADDFANEACLAVSNKDGVPYVQPPAELLQKMVSVRVHIDDSGVDNGPLRVIGGSHRHGRLTPEQIRTIRLCSTVSECVVPRGGVVVMRPLLLHASSKARVPVPRRVLQYLFAPAQYFDKSSSRHAA
jgi:ectoine hydroxylase-related dioxygenase (phytanoyl-CoA dioxygenase family)